VKVMLSPIQVSITVEALSALLQIMSVATIGASSALFYPFGTVCNNVLYQAIPKMAPHNYYHIFYWVIFGRANKEAILPNRTRRLVKGLER